MVRSYLRHGPTESFGVVCSSSSNSLYDGKKAYVPALEDVVVWDVKKGEQVRKHPGISRPYVPVRSAHRTPLLCLSGRNVAFDWAARFGNLPRSITYKLGHVRSRLRGWFHQVVVCIRASSPRHFQRPQERNLGSRLGIRRIPTRKWQQRY